jgi:hypothetical protein
MRSYEYKVVPAPSRGEKARGLKTTAERFAHALELAMNGLGSDGWEFVGAETLPVEEKTGFTGRVSTVYQNLLVFRRAVEAEVPSAEDEAASPARRTLLSFGRLRPGKASAKPSPPVTADDLPDLPMLPRLGPAEDEPAPPPFLGAADR